MLDAQRSLCSAQTPCCFIFINWEILGQIATQASVLINSGVAGTPAACKEAEQDWLQCAALSAEGWLYGLLPN